MSGEAGSNPKSRDPAERRHISSGSPWEALAGYSRAVVDGNDVFVSGTVGVNLATMEFAPTAREQAEQAIDTIAAALAQVPATLDDVVRVRVYVPNRADVEQVSAVLACRLGRARPANTTVCAPLAVEAAKVEIEVTARVRGAASAP